MTSPALTILSAPCCECPWKGKLAGGLRPGRLRQLREECIKGDAPFVCHLTTVDLDGPVSPVWDPGVAVCAGWLELDDPITVVQVATRLGLVEYVNPPTKESP